MLKPFKDYQRFFTFGCSLTNYIWPTWADIIAQEIPEHFNYGYQGAGNLFISNQVVEANLRHKFDKNDLIIIMWSEISREDRYKNDEWITSGNVYGFGLKGLDRSFVYQWANTRFYLIRDLALIELTQTYLEKIKCDFDMLSMIDIGAVHRQWIIDSSRVDDVLEHYRETLKSIKPSMLTSVFDGEWEKTPIVGSNGKGQKYDLHPTPLKHYSYIETLYPNLVTNKMKSFADEYHQSLLQCNTLQDVKDLWDIKKQSKTINRF